MIGGTQNNGIIRFLDLRAFDRQSEGVAVKKEFKKVDPLAN